MIDNDSIDKIKDMTVAAMQRNTLNTAVPAIILPNDYRLHNLDKYMNARSRFKGVFGTESINDFALYCKAEVGSAHIFIQNNDFKAQAIFDIGDKENPGHCEHQAVLKLKKTAPFRSVYEVDADVSSKKFTQLELAHWLEDWVPHLAAITADGEVCEMSKAITAVRNITIAQKKDVDHGADDFRASRTSMEEIEAKSRDGLPSFFIFTCNPFPDFREREIKLRLSVLTGDHPRFVLRIVQLETLLESIAEEFREKLDQLLQNKERDFRLYLGTFSD